MIVHDPENKFKIECVWAFISQDEKGNEGVIGAQLGGVMMPMVCADMERMEQLRPIAKKMAKETRKKIKLIKLHTREDVEVW